MFPAANVPEAQTAQLESSEVVLVPGVYWDEWQFNAVLALLEHVAVLVAANVPEAQTAQLESSWVALVPAVRRDETQFDAMLV